MNEDKGWLERTREWLNEDSVWKYTKYSVVFSVMLSAMALVSALLGAWIITGFSLVFLFLTQIEDVINLNHELVHGLRCLMFGLFLGWYWYLGFGFIGFLWVIPGAILCYCFLKDWWDQR